MARPRKIDSDLVTRAQRVAAHTGDIQELRMAQAILLPALGQMTLKAAGKVIGVGRATVARLQGRFRRWKQGIQAPRRRWGGRRRALMKLEDEASFLAGWKPKAEQGELVVVTALHGALVRTKSGPQAQAVSSLSPAGATPLAKSGSGHSAPQGPAGSAGGVEKKTLPEELAAVLKANVVRERPIRLMFQDEARFGRLARIRRCWAPAPLRPVVRNGYEREFTYVYGGVSPLQGQLDWSLSEKMNTSHMSAFLSQVSQAHPQEFIIMVLDGASSHKAKELVLPENIRLIRLPAYAPELNPQEHIWDEVREKAFPNLVLDQMTLVVERLKDGMGILAANADRVRSITAWPWIISLILKAN